MVCFVRLKSFERMETGDADCEGLMEDILRKQAEEEEMLELQIELANEEAKEKRIQADKKLKLERLRQQESEEEDFRAANDG